jgi:autotransporter-associated beta strand protein
LRAPGHLKQVDPAKRLVFGGSGGTITVDAAGVAANIGMEFEAAYTLNGGIITLGNISSVSVNAPVTINAPLAGTSGLTKLGTATLTLTSASNTFTGVITINAGTLAVTGDSQLGASDNDITLSGGLLALGNSFVMNAKSRAHPEEEGLRILVGNTLTTQGTVNVSSLDSAATPQRIPPEAHSR